MTASHWSGPMLSGPNKDAGDSANPYNQGFVVLCQVASLPFSPTTLVSQVALNLPPGAQILDIVVDIQTVYNSSGASTFSAGITSGATTYAGSVDVKSSAVRIRPTFSAAQLAAMNGITATGAPAPIPGPLFLTITSTGQPSAGMVTVDVMYNQLV